MECLLFEPYFHSRTRVIFFQTLLKAIKGKSFLRRLLEASNGSFRRLTSRNVDGKCEA